MPTGGQPGGHEAPPPWCGAPARAVGCWAGQLGRCIALLAALLALQINTPASLPALHVRSTVPWGGSGATPRQVSNPHELGSFATCVLLALPPLPPLYTARHSTGLAGCVTLHPHCHHLSATTAPA